MKTYTAVFTIVALTALVGLALGLGLAGLQSDNYKFSDKTVTVRHQGGGYIVQADGSVYGNTIVLSVHAEYAAAPDTSWVPKRQNLKQQPILRTVNGDSSFGYVRQGLRKVVVDPYDRVVPLAAVEVTIK